MKKLSLERETLAPLSPADLDNVNGATGTAFWRATWEGVKWITKNACPSITVEAVTRYLCPGNGGGNQGPQK